MTKDQIDTCKMIRNMVLQKLAEWEHIDSAAQALQELVEDIGELIPCDGTCIIDGRR